jgi:hypothetical protein
MYTHEVIINLSGTNAPPRAKLVPISTATAVEIDWPEPDMRTRLTLIAHDPAPVRAALEAALAALSEPALVSSNTER